MLIEATPRALPSVLKAALGAAALLAGSLSWAACSRTIAVPASPTGYSVIVKEGAVSGVYPEVLRQMGARSGCHFEFPVVPRARLEQMFFKTGDADILIPASRSTERDAQALFVPLIHVQPSLISMKARAASVSSVAQLLENKSLRVAVVRSFNYGDEYRALLAELEKDKRVDYVPQLSNVVSMLKLGRVDFTILAASLFYSTMVEAGESPDQMQFVNLEGLAVIESGAYLSTRALSAADVATLRALLAESQSSGVLWAAFEKYYPAAILRSVVSKRR